MSKFRFEEIAINSTEKKKPVESDKYTYLGLEHLDPGTLKVSRFGSDIAPIGEKLVMKKGDVLFGKRRAYQKKVAIAPFDGIFSAHGMVLRPKTEVIDSEFFPLFISSDYFLDAAIKISVGSLSPTINWKDLKNLEFELPDLETQRQLAKVLWALIDTIENYKVLMTKTDELVKSQFIELLNNNAGKLKLLSELEDDDKIILGRGQVISKEEISDNKGEFPVYSSSASNDGIIGLYSKYMFNDERITWSIDGGGKFFYRKPHKYSVTNVCGWLKVISKDILTEYLYYALSNEWSDKVYDYVHKAHPSVIRKEYRVLIPDISIQKKFIEFAHQSDKSKFHIRKLIQMQIAIWQKGGKIYANI